MNKEIKISVRNLIEFVLRSGDIDNSFRSNIPAIEGTRAHQKVQRSYGEEYKAEYTLKHKVDYEDFTLILEGRADGIFILPDETIIDEIKSTTKDLDTIEDDYKEIHWAQAMCYGYIYCTQNELRSINIQLTYFHIETEKKKIFKRAYSLEELEKFLYFLVEKYIQWFSISFDWENTRNESIRELNFPFKEYRKGQRELAVAAYKTIEERKNLFVQAPTGIGKTMSTLFPGLKAIGEGFASKIFYLTAKTITREVPTNSMDMLIARGLKAKTVIITAKDKICLNHEVKCNPRDCIYAKGHYDRVNNAIMDIFEQEDLMTRDVIIHYAEKHKVCPFEFTLDVCLWADVIICDYNYIFDPQVYLKRFFDIAGGNYIFLVDEAHNLVDRSREMFSTEINRNSFKDLKVSFKTSYPKIYKSLNKCSNIFIKIKEDLDINEEYYQREEISDFYFPILRLITLIEPWLIEEKNNEDYESVLDLYFNLISFIKIYELYNGHYVTSIQEVDGDIIFKLYCVDSSYLLREALKRSRASILFSATLTPLEYYMNLLGGSKEDYHIRLSSPFPQNNLSVLLGDSISTKYKDRENTYKEIVEYIYNFIFSRKGNYLIFFPSYVYMNRVYELLKEKDSGLNLLIQDRQMSDRQREDFLEYFEEEEVIGFAVLGGLFSEGIDLIGDKLIGAVIVGVGMPMICFERDIIKDYFNHTGLAGFEYAYVYPGMNKVLQAAGRVIRSEEDKGSILLIDDRYKTYRYKNLLPTEWSHYLSIKNKRQLKEELNRFWMI